MMQRSSRSSSLRRRALNSKRKQRREVCETFSGLPLGSSDLTNGPWGETPLYCLDSDYESEYGEELAYYGYDEVRGRFCTSILGW